jgi:hypothetical protein
VIDIIYIRSLSSSFPSKRKEKRIEKDEQEKATRESYSLPSRPSPLSNKKDNINSIPENKEILTKKEKENKERQAHA